MKSRLVTVVGLVLAGRSETTSQVVRKNLEAASHTILAAACCHRCSSTRSLTESGLAHSKELLSGTPL